MLRFPRVTAILFDFDGTLVDTSEAIWAAYVAVLEGRGHPLPEPAWLRRRIGRPLKQIFIEALGPMDAAAVDALVAEYREAFFRHAGSARALPGAAATVDHFRDRVPLAIATSRTAEGARLLLEAVGLRGFRAVVGIEDITRPKPDPEPLHRALALLGVAPDHALMVGDTPDDILAARRGGLHAVAVASGFHPREDLAACGPDLVLDRLDELIEAVGGAD